MNTSEKAETPTDLVDEIPHYYDPITYGMEKRMLTILRREAKAAKKAGSVELLEELIDELEVMALRTYAHDIRETAEKTIESIR